MNGVDKADRNFDENLKAAGRQLSAPASPSPEVVSRSAAAFYRVDRTVERRRLMSRPAFWSSLGLAASIAVVAGLLFPWGSSTNVQAATILAKLDQQVAKGTLIEIDIDSFETGGALINAHLQIAKEGIGGDVSVTINDGGGMIAVDLSLGVTDDEGWVMLRKLSVPSPQAQLFLGMLGLANGETLILLPEGTIGDEIGLEIEEAMRELRSADLGEVFRQIIDDDAIEGATVEEQADGTLLLTLPIEDSGGVESIIRRFGAIHDNADDEAGGAPGDNAKGDPVVGRHVRRIHARHHSAHDHQGLIGRTVQIVYDPASEMVRSVKIDKFGDANGSISVVIREGEVDPALFDSSRVRTPQTRVLDLADLEGLVEQMGGAAAFHEKLRKAHSDEK